MSKKLHIIVPNEDSYASKYVKLLANKLGSNVEFDFLNKYTPKEFIKSLFEDIAEKKEYFMVIEPLEFEKTYLEYMLTIFKDNDIEYSNGYRITPYAIFKLIEGGYLEKGTSVVIINRTSRIGLPLASLLIEAGATVTICNSNTDDVYLRESLRNADIVVTATNGKFDGCTLNPESLEDDFIRDYSDWVNGQVVIDVSDDFNSSIIEKIKLQGEYFTMKDVGQWTLEELKRRLDLC